MVKNPLFPLPSFDRLLPRFPQLRLVYVGPILDPGEGEPLSRRERGHGLSLQGGEGYLAQYRRLVRAPLAADLLLCDGA